MAKNPLDQLISVIIPAYNAALTIEETLAYVFNQTYKNYEIIVVNDGSTDDTLAILNNYQDRIKIISTINQGVSIARTIGVEASIGNYIQYLDADDLLTSNKLEIQLNALNQSESDVAYGDWQRFIVSNNKIKITETISKTLGNDLEIEIFTDFWCPPATLLYSREIVKKLRWNKNLPVIQDARYLLDASIAKAKFIYTPKLVALYRDGQANSLSKKNNVAFLRDCYINGKEIFELWNADGQISLSKKEAVLDCLRYCIHEFRALDKALFNEAINYILKIEPNYIPKQKGILRTISKMFGYRNAELIASIKERLK